ncbi:MAG: DUF1285 domain-containing protein [Methyloceanibacter sp.]|uniref:DUF1285 domain-containing protein n=1 Tax=Methyloceanibacter sp. TaxID=1965321 RepID=UPI003D9BFD11
MPDQKRDIFVAPDDARGKPRQALLPNLNVCGDIGLKIGGDGTWYYEGSPIRRLPLVRLFASVLRLEGDGNYYLVTPAEKVPIEVADLPFVAVEMFKEGEGRDQRLSFRTNVDDVVTANGEHTIGFQAAARGDFVPSIVVRDGLKARLARPVYYELAALTTEGPEAGSLGVWSGGAFFAFPATAT